MRPQGAQVQQLNGLLSSKRNILIVMTLTNPSLPGCVPDTNTKGYRLGGVSFLILTTSPFRRLLGKNSETSDTAIQFSE